VGVPGRGDAIGDGVAVTLGGFAVGVIVGFIGVGWGLLLSITQYPPS
jgi:F0F1-type ATP synthase membrane subunit c/vacuolar-type H+-ATPase subunit K